MNRNEAKEEARRRATELFSPDRTGKGWICPICKSGDHAKGTGITTKDGIHFSCWKGCYTNADIFDIVGQEYGLVTDTERFSKVYELLNIQVDNQRTSAASDFKREAEPMENRQPGSQISAAEADCMPYFRKCAADIGSTDYLQRRGISAETAKRFLLGFDAHYTKSTGGNTWQALIIPTGRSSYVARNTDQNADRGNRYRKTGSAQIFNSAALEKSLTPICIVEGEIDAMSIVEAGGEAIGLGSIANVPKFLKELESRKPQQPLILSLDNEEEPEKQEAIEKRTKELEDGCKSLGIPFYRRDMAVGYHDANEALLENRAAFEANIKALPDFVKEEQDRQRQEELRAYQKKNSAGAALQLFIKGITESVNTTCIPTGFSALDKVLDGGLYEGLYCVGAISSLGKTTIILQIADQIAAAGNDVLIFSLEMARTQLMSKSISRHTYQIAIKGGIDTRNAKTSRGITDGKRYENYSRTEVQLITDAIQAYGGYAERLYIHEGIGDIGVIQIREAVEKHIRLTGRRPLVICDYLQILAPYSDRSTDKQNTDKAVLELKRISRDFKLPVIAISSFNRDNYKAAVNMAAFKESGAVEYSSDVLIGLQLKGAGDKNFDETAEKRKTPREVELVILKNRDAGVGDKVLYKYYAMFNVFEEVGVVRN